MKKQVKKEPKLVYTRQEMYEFNVKALEKRGVKVSDIVDITYRQQSKYIKDVPMNLCEESVEKILSLRDTFHYVQLAVEIDVLAEQKKLSQPLQDIIHYDLGLFGVDEVMALDLAGIYGTIGETNFGDIDVNKHGIVRKLNEDGKKEGVCHTFLDDIVGAIAAAAATRVAQIINEDNAHKDPQVVRQSLFDNEFKK